MAEPIEIPFEESGAGDASAAARDLAEALGEASMAAREMAESEEATAAAHAQAGESSAFAVNGLADLKAGFDLAVDGAVAAYDAVRQFGDEMERQRGVMNRLAGNTELAADAVGGLVSDIDLAIARNQVAAAGLQVTEQQFADLVEVATDYAAATGGDAVAATNQLTMALISGRRQGLERFGLEISNTTDRAALMEDALSQLRVRAAEMETGADTAGGQFAVLDAQIDNAQTRTLEHADIIAQRLTPAFGQLVGAMIETDDVGSRWERGMQRQTRLVEGASAAVAQQVTNLAQLVQTFRTMNVEALPQAIENWLTLRGVMEAGEEATQQRANEDFLAVTERVNAAIEAASEAELRRRNAIADRATALSAAEGAARAAAEASRARASASAQSAEERVEAMLAELADLGKAERVREEQHRSEMRRAQELAIAEQEGANRRARAIAQREAEREAAASQREEETRLLNERIRAANAQGALVEQSHTAAMAFRDSWTQGVDAVIAALHRANEAADEAGARQVSAMEAASTAAAAAASQMGDSLLGGVANAFAESAKAAIKGEKSFGEALGAMLEDTLYSVGTQATVLSIFEFAKAIASAASQDYAGAAAHAAAGAAFAGVAVAAFAGGAAATAASGGGASAGTNTPASPVSPANDNGGGGDNITYNITFGGPVVTAATEAELGRRIKGTIGTGEARYGVAA